MNIPNEAVEAARNAAFDEDHGTDITAKAMQAAIAAALPLVLAPLVEKWRTAAALSREYAKRAVKNNDHSAAQDLSNEADDYDDRAAELADLYAPQQEVGGE